MALSRWERKARLKHGDGLRIAKRTGRDEATVSKVISGLKRDPVIEKEAARRMKPATTPEEAFGPMPNEETAPETSSSSAA